MNIILLGAPGSGKGTQSELLCQSNGYTQLSTGDLFRANISNNTDLGIEAQKYMNEGKLVPDSVTNEMVKEYLKTKNDNLIFDGYPRTNDQAQALDEMLSEFNKKINYVFHIKMDESLLMDRLTGRMICSICKRSYHIKNRKPINQGVCDFDNGTLIVREDDKPEKIKVRLKEYNNLTAPLIKYFNDKIIEINADHLDPSQVYEQIIEVLNK